MSYVYMYVLELAPLRYERGMRVLTLGQLEQVHQDIAAKVRAGDRVLDIGCGTGALAVALARRGARVTAIDIAAPMLAQAAQRVREAELGNLVELRELGAAELETVFSDASFDWVVSTLVFSELSDDEIEYTLAECQRVLRTGGQLMIADEVMPRSVLGKIGTFLFRLPFVILAFLLTQNTTRRVAQLETRISDAGFRIVDRVSYLLRTMELVVAQKVV